MIPRIDADLGDVYRVLEHYGCPASVQTRYYGPISAYIQDSWASIELEVMWKPECPVDDPWAIRQWQQEQVRACIADLQARGWYLHRQLRIEHGGHVGGDLWTLNGDCVNEPEQSGISCTAYFEVYGFPPSAKIKKAA